MQSILDRELHVYGINILGACSFPLIPGPNHKLFMRNDTQIQFGVLLGNSQDPALRIPNYKS